MKKKVLIIAPHPDDETLGCGGYILKNSKILDIHLLFVTKMKNTKKDRKYLTRSKQISKINKIYKFKSITKLNYYTSEMDLYPRGEIINKLSQVLSNLKPDEILIPSSIDVHSDHKIINECSISASKSFRNPYLKKIIEYEVLSETNFSLKETFKPNYFVDVSDNIKKKIQIMKIYKSELKKHPFPRSIDSIRSLAILRGSQAGFKFAESFKIIFSKE